MTKKEEDLKEEAPSEMEELKVQVAALLEDKKKKDEMIADLMKVADKGRLAMIADGKNKLGPNRYKVGQCDGAFIIGWSTVEDKVEKGPAGNWIATQIYKIQLSDGKEKRVSSYLNFSDLRYSNPAIVEELSRESDVEGNLVIKVKVLDTGETLSINAKFLN